MKLINWDCLEEIKNIDYDIIVTDPPFNIGYKYNSYKDKLKEEEYYNMLSNIIGDKPAVVIHYWEQLHKLSIKLGKAPEKVISWVYNSNTWKQHRQIAFYWIKPDFKKVTQPYKNLKDKRIIKRISEWKLWAKLYDWWNINQVKNVSKDKTDHSCQMPIEVMNNVIWILPDNITILDPFMWSGTTWLACKNTNRDFIGIELDETYFNIAKERITWN
jgi:site-specific DNA-methyltransferase (adenine-specific)